LAADVERAGCRRQRSLRRLVYVGVFCYDVTLDGIVVILASVTVTAVKVLLRMHYAGPQPAVY